jgi:IS5 family transposase
MAVEYWREYRTYFHIGISWGLDETNVLRTTIKTQILVDTKTQEIICIEVRKGRVHDFRMWKESQIELDEKIELLADKGYQGVNKIQANSRIPMKRPKKKSLNKEQKKFNRQLAKERIIVEHVHRRPKIFRILSSRYRCRRRRFGLRFNLITGIYNYGIYLSSQQAIA